MTCLVDRLRKHGERIAVLTDDTTLTYRQLADRVAAATGQFGSRRRLVLLETRNDTATLVHYLAALAGRHVVIPVPAGRDHSAIVDTYRPDIVVGADGVTRHGDGGHRLNEDLALLLSTSGSTGSPKLVRLSHANLAANAASIAEYLDIRETDRAATTLPMSYCYGLSVVHSHLLRGAGLILTDRSVVDAEFWTLFRRHRGTSLAGVPYTFELLEQVGIDAMTLPHLRYVTQAGGRMAPERVHRFAELGRRQGWQLFVMYGATEATARMAYLPPELAASRPTAIGRPIPGGAFTIEPIEGWDDPDTGELIYHGANVMMGYATGPADLALGRSVDALRTGDVARRAPDGLYEVVGRASRFVKMYGLRIDLQRVEATLRRGGVAAYCTDDGDRLAVAAVGRHDEDEVRELAAACAGVPVTAVHAVAVPEPPLLPSGKPDYPRVRQLTRPAQPARPENAGLREVFADVLHLDPHAVDPDASFVDLGGNSLTYVAASVRVERALGRLPADWHRRPIAELEKLAVPARRRRVRTAALETSVALRAAAIVLVVGSHAELWQLWGGAHILLGVAGYNFGRFCLTPLPRADRIRHLRSTIAWIAVPAVVWVAIALLITDDYTVTNLLLANKFLGPHHSMTAGRLWFVEVVVWTLVALALLFWLPLADRAERRWPFGFAAALLAVGLALRYDVLGLHLGREAWFTMLAFWFFAVGWAATKASSALQRALVTAVAAVGVHGYFADTHREALVLTGLVLLIWLPALRCPPALAALAGLLAEASLYTYLIHFQVYPLFPGHPLVGVVAALVAGVALTQAVHRLRAWVRRVRSTPAPARRSAPPVPVSQR